jgi:purine-binding chemotaxis protein CheW
MSDAIPTGGRPVDGYVTFALSGQVYATPLAAVREIVRLTGLEALPAMAPPLAGVLDLRGAPLPVHDIRAAGPDGTRTGAVLVLEPVAGAAAVGFAVDSVRAVVPVEALTPARGEVATDLLPGYVVDVRRDGDRQVLVVDLRRMSALVAA